MRKPALTTSLLSVTFLVAGALAPIPAVWAKPPVCDDHKPNQYDPVCVCPDGTSAISGRLPTDSAEDNPVSVYPQGGAEYVICVPPPPFWNGSMVFASMGTVRLEPNEKEGTIVTVASQLDLDGELTLPGLFNGAGYGFAVVAPPQLLSVPSREADLARLVEVVEDLVEDLFEEEIGYSYVLGISQGAIPATRLLESTDLFDGGISACGPIGSFGSVPGQMQPSEPPLYFNQIEYSLHLVVITDYFFPELKLLRNTPPPFDKLPPLLFDELPQVPASTLATWDEDAVEAVLDDPSNEAKVDRLLDAMSGLGLPVATDPTEEVSREETLAEVLKEVTSLVNDYVSDLGGSTFDNSSTVYPDPELNEGVRRYSATVDPAEVLSSYETSGLLYAPLVALHNLWDHRVPYAHVPLYEAKSNASPGPFVPFPIPLGGIPSYGHCNFTAPEAGAAILCLKGIVEEGELLQFCTVQDPP